MSKPIELLDDAVTLVGALVHVAEPNGSGGYNSRKTSPQAIAAGAPITRTVAFFFTTSPTASEELLIWTAPAGETVTFADEFAGAAGISIDPPAASPFVLIVKKDGVEVGTISIATSGAITFATSGGTVSIIGGTNYLTVEGPVTIDATCSRSSFTLIGTAS